MTTKHKIKMDLIRRGVSPKINAVQGDICSREVELSLFADGIPWNVPDDAAAIIRYRKPDRTSGAYDTLPDGRSAAVIRGSTVTVTIAPDVLALPGEVPLVVSLISCGQELSTFEFLILVEPNHSAGISSQDDPVSITGMLPSPASGETGQVLVIEEVTDTGKIKKLKAVDLPSGNSIADISLESANAVEATSLYRITMTDGTAYYFTVSDGKDGSSCSITVTEEENGYCLQIDNISTGGGASSSFLHLTNGKSAYSYAQDGGYTGTEEEFAEKLTEELPTKVSQLENDSGYLTAAPVTSVNGKTGEVTIDIPEVPGTLPNPAALTINGTTYDGSNAVDMTEQINAMIDAKLEVIENGTY